MSALSDDTEMVALGSRGEPAEPEFPAAGVDAVVGAGLTGPTQSFGAFASADPGPSSPPPEGGPPPSSGGGETPGGGAESGGAPRANPWDRDSGTFGGFGLSGRNGRFLHGGRPAPEGRPGLNGRTPDLNGRTTNSASAQLGDRDTVDHPVSSQPDFPGSSPADPENPAADAAHQNGRDEMSGRAEVPGYPTTGETEPGEPGRRRDPGDADSPRRQATGWASVPTSTNPVVEPTSGAPVSSAPGSDDPVSGVHASGSAAPVSPAYQPPAFPYGQAPSSGVPAPRAPGQVSPPAFPSTFPPAPGFTPGGFPSGVKPTEDGPAATGRGSAAVPAPSVDEAPASPAADAPTSGAGPAADLAAAGRANTADLAAAPTAPATDTTPDDDRFGLPVGLRPADEGIALGGRRGWDDDGSTSPTPAQRRSASLEDAEPVRRGRRAAPDDDDDAPDEAGMRPGDVAAGHITFWDDDATRHFRDAWHEVKAEFVDDPVTALTRAHDLLTDAVNELTEALLAERDELDPLRSTAAPDTESMRMAMRGYREFLDRILAL